MTEASEDRGTMSDADLSALESEGLSEEPIEFVVSTSRLRSHCSHCLKDAPDLKRCGGCRKLYFCSSACQRGGWTSHKRECPLLKALGHRTPPDTPRLIARLLLRFKAEPDAAHSAEGSAWPCDRSYASLLDHAEEMAKDPTRTEHLATIAQVLHVYLGADLVPSAAELRKMYGRIVVNGLAILDADLNPVGLGLYRAFSGFDHSCRPSACVTFVGPRAHLRLLRPSSVSSLRDVRLGYCDLLPPTAERRSQLAQQFYFRCTCDACEKGPELDARKLGLRCPKDGCEGVASEVRGCSDCGAALSLEAVEAGSFATGRAQWELEELEKAAAAELPDSRDVLRRAQGLLRSVDAVAHAHSAQRLRCLERCMDAAMELQLVAQALGYARDLLPLYVRYLHAQHPNLCLHRAKLAKLLLHQGRLDEAREELGRAQRSAEASFPGDHPLRASLRDLLEECDESLRLQLHAQQIAVEDAD